MYIQALSRWRILRSSRWNIPRGRRRGRRCWPKEEAPDTDKTVKMFDSAMINCNRYWCYEYTNFIGEVVAILSIKNKKWKWYLSFELNTWSGHVPNITLTAMLWVTTLLRMSFIILTFSLKSRFIWKINTINLHHDYCNEPWNWPYCHIYAMFQLNCLSWPKR